jgi:hypothetical protein
MRERGSMKKKMVLVVAALGLGLVFAAKETQR